MLTGHVTRIAGPETVPGTGSRGVMTLSIALNYCELATTFPVTWWGNDLCRRGFWQGLADVSGGFAGYAFEHVLCRVERGWIRDLTFGFHPELPIIPIAAGDRIRWLYAFARCLERWQPADSSGSFLVCIRSLLFKGFSSASGFQMETFLSGRVVFENQSPIAHLGRMLTAIALTYNAYVGFEVIADDAEEITQPNKNIPIGILVSLLLTTIIYSLVSLITIGTVPFEQLAGSEVALTDAAARFWPTIGVN